jgi:hypothetical protein
MTIRDGKTIVHATSDRRKSGWEMRMRGGCEMKETYTSRSSPLLLIPVTQRLACRSYNCSSGADYAVMRKSRVRISLGILFAVYPPVSSRMAAWASLLHLPLNSYNRCYHVFDGMDGSCSYEIEHM